MCSCSVEIQRKRVQLCVSRAVTQQSPMIQGVSTKPRPDHPRTAESMLHDTVLTRTVQPVWGSISKTQSRLHGNFGTHHTGVAWFDYTRQYKKARGGNRRFSAIAGESAICRPVGYGIICIAADGAPRAANQFAPIIDLSAIGVIG